MMTSQHGAGISKFQENSFINEYITSKFLFLLPSFYHHQYMRYEFGPFLSQFWVDDVTTLSQNFRTLREQFHKRIIYLKVPYTLHLSINIGTLPISPFLTNFWVADVTTGSQNFKILIVVPKTKTSPQISV